MKISSHKRVLGTMVAGLALSAIFAAPSARAADTTTTFTVNGGSLAVSAPSASNLSAGVSVGTSSVSAALGTVQVTDQRSVIGGAWTATVSSTNFTTDDGGAGEVIDNANAAYTTGLTTLASGAAVVVPSAVAASLDSAQTAATATLVLGDSVVTWSPTVAVTIPDNVAAGTYSGTLTHSVA
jgi:hypothetical protein